MILNTEESNDRLSSPNNLLNKLKSLTKEKSRSNSMDMFIGQPSSNSGTIPSLPDPATVKSTLDEIEEEFKNGLIKNTAKHVLGESLVALSKNMGNVEKTTDYARIAVDMGKIVSGMEAASAANKTINNQQVIIYRPIINSESAYQIVHANE